MRKASKATRFWRSSICLEGFSLNSSQAHCITDCDFADDLALLGNSEEELQLVTDAVLSEALKIPLRVGVLKTKCMAKLNRETGVAFHVIPNCGTVRGSRIIVQWEDGRHLGRILPEKEGRYTIRYDDGEVSTVRLLTASFLLDEDDDPHSYALTCSGCLTSFGTEAGLNIHIRSGCIPDNAQESIGQWLNGKTKSATASARKRLKKSSCDITIKSLDREERFGVVNEFKYLGGILTVDGSPQCDVLRRIGLAGQRFAAMKKLLTAEDCPLKLRVRVLASAVFSIALYSCESWVLTPSLERKIDSFQLRCLRRLLKLSYLEHVRNEEVYTRCECIPLSKTVRSRRLKWFGHVVRMSSSATSSTLVQLPKVVMEWNPVESRPDDCKPKRGRQLRLWEEVVKDDLREMNLRWKDREEICEDRDGWKRSVYTHITISL